MATQYTSFEVRECKVIELRGDSHKHDTVDPIRATRWTRSCSRCPNTKAPQNEVHQLARGCSWMFLGSVAIRWQVSWIAIPFSWYDRFRLWIHGGLLWWEWTTPEWIVMVWKGGQAHQQNKGVNAKQRILLSYLLCCCFFFVFFLLQRKLSNEWRESSIQWSMTTASTNH